MRTIEQIASEIEDSWAKVSPYARPYLDAMHTLTTINDNYMYDSGRSVVLYFLANTSGWKGEKAKAIKAELKAMLK